MTYTATVAGGKKDVVLPNGSRYQVGAAVVLSDDENAMLSAGALASLVTDAPLGGTASYAVTIAAGKKDVVLPDGLRHQAGAVVTLSDDEYSTISPAAKAALFSSTVVTVRA